jgi:hypothetical protein
MLFIIMQALEARSWWQGRCRHMDYTLYLRRWGEEGHGTCQCHYSPEDDQYQDQKAGRDADLCKEISTN